MILEGLGTSGADLAKKLENVAKIYATNVPLEGSFSTIIAKMWASKNRLFFRPCIFGPKSVQAPPEASIMTDLGPKR